MLESRQVHLAVNMKCRLYRQQQDYVKLNTFVVLKSVVILGENMSLGLGLG